MKKRLSLLLCIVMVLAMIVPAAAAADTAQPTQDAVTVDGSKVAVAGYKISDNNYFKLRDLAAAVAGTGKYPGCAALGGTRRQVSPKTPISKDGIFLSRNVEIVRFFLAGYT